MRRCPGAPTKIAPLQPHEAHPDPNGERAAFGPTLALTATLALGCAALAIAGVLLVVHPTALPPPLQQAKQNQHAETGLYLLVFAVLGPLWAIAAPRIADRIRRGAQGPALGVLTGALAALLLAVLLAARICDLLFGGGAALVLVATLAWGVVTALALRRSSEARPWPALLRHSGHGPAVWTVVALLGVGSLVAVTSLRSVSVVPLGIGLAAAVLASLLHVPPGAPKLPRLARVAVDVAVIVLLALAVPDLVIFRPEDAGTDPVTAINISIVQFHQNFLLGPVNEVMAGGAVLVDTASQYGVAPIYLIAAWFGISPEGYGSFGLLDGVLTALLYIVGYGVLRIAGTPRWIAVPALAVGVIALVFNLDYPVGQLPEQGPLRFGLPMLVIAAAVLGARWPRRRALARWTAAAVVGLSSIWAFEALLYTLGTFAALTALEAAMLPAPRRRRSLLGSGARTALACVCAHLVLVLGTVVVAGELPDWGQYLVYLNGFIFGQLGDITYDFSPWSPGLLIGGGYLVSACAIALLVIRHRALVARERVALTGLIGLTAYGIVLFSYFVDRSGDGILAYVCFPALLTGALWLALICRVEGTPARARQGGFLLASAVATFVVATAWSGAADGLSRSALSHAPPGGKSLRDAIHRLRHPPPLDPRAPVGEALLERYMPGSGPALVLTAPDLSTEILIRSRRTSAFGFSDPIEETFISDYRLPSVRDHIRLLDAGDRILVDQAALGTLAKIRDDPSFHPLSTRTTQPLAPLQSFALALINARFGLRTIHSGATGFAVVELVGRKR